tara:strand:+ start:12651 stop:13007 length:357 start_codon:yes stop_codon:yes gene_type:complete
MLSQLKDITAELNANNVVNVDVSQWQNCTIHLSGNITGTINVLGSNDAGAVQAVTDGNATSAANFTAIQGTNLATGATITAVAAAGNFKFVVGTKFIQIGGTNAATSGKIILFLNTPT